ncbi:MAG: pyruvate kinase [Desulfobulbaceae bacterium]|nr:MAG: pyruvate kinase [Desulfobulbaceae bacterium]
MNPLRKTKIVCTIGPRTASYEMLKKLALGGMNIARLNMSHGDHGWHGRVINHLKRINRKEESGVAILLDTKGPEIRTGDVSPDIHLKSGDTLTFTVRRKAVLEERCVEVSYDGFIDDVALDDIILVDGGMLHLQVISKGASDIICRSLDDGLLGSRRHLNIRGKSADLPSITDKDRADIAFAIEQGVDFIALSFIRSAAAIKDLQRHLRRQKARIDLVAKIESAEAIPHLPEIIAVADGVMIARGDLGAELPFEEVPHLQEEITRRCRQAGKPVIVATHMLESMIINPTPTRAEVTDITQAVLQEVDCVMLSGETATGKYPLKALAVMDQVARRTEERLALDPKVRGEASDNAKHEIARTAAILNNNLHAKAILVFTRRGLMAVLVSGCRPHAPIHAFTNSSHVKRRLAIHWGVQAFIVKFSKAPETTIRRAVQLLSSRGIVSSGDRVIVVSDILADGTFVETVQVRII